LPIWQRQCCLQGGHQRREPALAPSARHRAGPLWPSPRTAGTSGPSLACRRSGSRDGFLHGRRDCACPGEWHRCRRGTACRWVICVLFARLPLPRQAPDAVRDGAAAVDRLSFTASPARCPCPAAALDDPESREPHPAAASCRIGFRDRTLAEAGGCRSTTRTWRHMMSLKKEILELSRRAATGLSPWFDSRLDGLIERGSFLPGPELERVAAKLLGERVAYREQAGVGTVVLGISGGVDSALPAAMFKRAGWQVIGFTLPIEQDPDETERGIETCAALGLEHHNLDLTDQYRGMVAALGALDPRVADGNDEAHRTRRGNVRARLMMVTLYDQAHRYGRIVASTDNFSELAAGYWTLHGDVGDLSPVQSLLKSWEVPWMARHFDVPERIWRAKPTDGLGISAGDEAQIGASYLEFDILLLEMIAVLKRRPGL